jgi:hypothetical protein
VFSLAVPGCAGEVNTNFKLLAVGSPVFLDCLNAGIAVQNSQNFIKSDCDAAQDAQECGAAQGKGMENRVEN